MTILCVYNWPVEFHIQAKHYYLYKYCDRFLIDELFIIRMFFVHFIAKADTHCQNHWE